MLTKVREHVSRSTGRSSWSPRPVPAERFRILAADDALRLEVELNALGPPVGLRPAGEFVLRQMRDHRLPHLGLTEARWLLRQNLEQSLLHRFVPDRVDLVRIPGNVRIPHFDRRSLLRIRGHGLTFGSTVKWRTPSAARKDMNSHALEPSLRAPGRRLQRGFAPRAGGPAARAAG